MCGWKSCTSPDFRVLLDLDECADLGFVADLAAVQIDELRQLDVFAQLDVGRNASEVVHAYTASPLSLQGLFGRFQHPHHSQARHAVVERSLVVLDAVDEVCQLAFSASVCFDLAEPTCRRSGS